MPLDWDDDTKISSQDELKKPVTKDRDRAYLIVLAGASEPARELLHLLDLETLWALYDTRKEALEALSGSD